MSPSNEDGEPSRESPKRPGRRRRYLFVVGGLLLIVGVLAGIKFAQIHALIGMGKRMTAAGPPPEAVATDVAQASSWETSLAAVGSVTGVESVAVSNDAPGIVAHIGFESGALVQRGQVLVRLDATPERAQLAAAKARRDNAELTAGRTRTLLARGAVTKEQFDTDDTQLKTATADMAALQAQIERKIVRAPFQGRLGIRAINLGQYLNAGTTVTSLDRGEGTFVDFTLPQEQLANVKVGMPVRITLNGAANPVAGKITAVDPTVDNSSRNLRLRATVTEPAAGLRPGMFVNVAVVLPQRPEVVTVPATAIVHASYGDSVFLIEPKPPGSPGMTVTQDGKQVLIARQQIVRVGGARGDFVAVAQGLTPGQRVASAGVFKLRNGSPVVVDNKVKPTAQLDPRPENR